MTAYEYTRQGSDFKMIWFQVLKSLIDALVFVLSVASLIMAGKYFGLFPVLSGIDVFYGMILFYFPSVAVDFFLFGENSIIDRMSRRINETRSEILDDFDTMEDVETEFAGQFEKQSRPAPRQIVARIETQEGKHLRSPSIVPTDQEGGFSVSPGKVLDACDAFVANGLVFSQPKSGLMESRLSSSAFTKLRKFWLSQKLIEEDPQSGEGRYRFTRHGVAVVKAVSRGDMPPI